MVAPRHINLPAGLIPLVNVPLRDHPIELPIDLHLDRIVAHMQSHNCLIVEAPPGTGKTTRAAPALLPLATSQSRPTTSDAFPTGKVLLIQPRRIAARAAAARISSEMHSPLGQLIGYQVRFDSRVSPASRLIAMTPGILLRHLQSDGVLSDVAAVVLDEFHERSLEVDLLLGMLRRLQLELRPELRLMLMSATLDSQQIAAYLNHPPIVSIAVHSYPVKKIFSRYQPTATRGRTPPSPSRRIVEQCVATTREAAAAHEGDILVFLPGVGEIHQIARELEPDAQRHDWQLLNLFGDMSPEDQDRVLAPSRQRKVILSTNVAETSLTIENVRIVIDSGWARVQRIDPALGLNMLVLEPISNASADQRTGRAGRTAPGVCYRLWDEITGRARAAFLEPEVLRVDLSGGVLQLLCWGEADVAAFPWLTAPSLRALEQAMQCLQLLGAVGDDGQVTPLGRYMNQLPVQPRLARLLLAGNELGIPRQAALAASCLSERDIFDRRAGGGRESSGRDVVTDECDLTRQVVALQRFEKSRQTEHDVGTIKISAAHNVLRVAEQLQRLLEGANSDKGKAKSGGGGVGSEHALRRALLVAFPDRLTLRRSAGQPRGLMVGGRGVKLDESSSVRKADLFLCLDVDAGGTEARVRKASAIESQWLPEALLSQRDERFFHPTAEAVVTRRRSYFLDLLLSETPIETPADEQTAELLARAAAERFERLLPPKDKPLHSWLARVGWLLHQMPEAPLPSLAPENLAKLIGGWCFGLRKLDELKQLPWKQLLEAELSSAGRKLLSTQAPEQITLPSGRVVLLQYEAGKPPVLAARIQEFFGWTQTPRLAEGRVPLLLHLLAPNGRVHQITDDLASFWANTYPLVRKELRGRYPKHAWPENPLMK